jgi:DNA polymerase III delta subunit
MSAPNVGYFWGDDGFGLERAAATLATGVASESGSGERLETWRIDGAVTTPSAIHERIATGTLFGGGTLVIVNEPGPLIRSADGRTALAAILPAVAPGNALVFLDPMDRFARQLDTGRSALAEAVKTSGGEARGLQAPKGPEMSRWITDRARERAMHLGPGAAQELARRLGALVNEADVKRRYQGQLAVSELDKLALLRQDGEEVTLADVTSLVVEAVPGSTWAFLDALGERRTKQAAELLGRLIETTPQPLLLAQMYGRVRQLLEATDRIASGEDQRSLPRTMGLSPYPAQKLAAMTHHWTVPELEAALEGLFELDVLVKGSDGTAVSDQARQLAFTMWLAEHVTRR